MSCDGAKTTFTGIQLVTHTVPRGGTVNEPPGCSADLSRCVEGRGSGLAAAAFSAALLGFALGLLGLRRGPGWCACAGLVATLLLGMEPFDIFGPDVTFHSGYYLTLLFTVWAAALHAWRRWCRRRAERRGGATAGLPAASPSSVASAPRFG